MEKGVKLTHYKGGKYTVYGKGTHTETEEEMIIYKSDKDNKLWVRPLAMFSEMVEHEEEQVVRFKPTQKEKLNIEYKAKRMNECECYGKSLVERIYLNGEETDYKDFIMEVDKKIFNGIIERYNQGVRFFEVHYLVTKEDDEYFIINGKVYKAGMYPLTLEKFLKIINVEYEMKEHELK